MILADEHISAKMIAAIKAIPLEVASVKEKFKGADDNRIIEFAPKMISSSLLRTKILVNGFSLIIFQAQE